MYVHVGRILDPLGKPLDGLGPLENIDGNRPTLAEPVPGIAARVPMNSIIFTGLKLFDMFQPLFRGSRVALIGNRLVFKF